MTRTDMQVRLQNYFNNAVFYDTQSLNDSVQDSLDEIVAFTGCVYKSVVLPFTANTTYYDMLSLLPDYIGVIAVFNNTIRKFMFPESLKKFNQVRIDWDTALGTPYYFSPVSHRYMAIYMKPGTANYGTMSIFYRASAPVLTDTTAIPLPDDNLTVLDNLCITDLNEQAQEWSKATTSLKTYIVDIEELRLLIKNQRNRDRYMGLR